MTEKELDAWFEGKPDTYEQFRAVRKQIEGSGRSELSIGKQISFGTSRKFVWFWLYNVTGKTPNGLLHVQLAIDGKVDDEHVRSHTEIGKYRWNHQIVIRSLDDAKSAWLGTLIERAYAYGTS